MSLLSIPTEEVLALLANKLLPARSGQNKVLIVDLEIVFEDRKLEYVKICFWHPNNYMLVGYCTEAAFDFRHGLYNITANHDSTWKSDGLSFTNKISPGFWVEEVKIKTFDLITITDPVVDDDKRVFAFNIV